MRHRRHYEISNTQYPNIQSKMGQPDRTLSNCPSPGVTATDANLAIGDWGLEIGDWGLGVVPIPNPRSPVASRYFFA